MEIGKTYITGSNGFIGGNLKDRLRNPICLKHEHIQSTDFSDASKVFFLSAYGNMAHHSGVDDIVNANITDLTHTLSTVNWNKIESFVYFSTSSVKLRIQTAYSRTKRAAEEILLSYMEGLDVPITIIRPMSVTGVGEQEKHLIPTLIRNMINEDPITLVPEPVHDFIDVQDVVNGVMNLSDHKARGIFELGTGNGYSNAQILAMLIELTGIEPEVKLVENMRPYDSDNWVSTNFNSRKYGWNPKKDIMTSLREMVTDYVK